MDRHDLKSSAEADIREMGQIESLRINFKRGFAKLLRETIQENPGEPHAILLRWVQLLKTIRYVKEAIGFMIKDNQPDLLFSSPDNSQRTKWEECVHDESGHYLLESIYRQKEYSGLVPSHLQQTYGSGCSLLLSPCSIDNLVCGLGIVIAEPRVASVMQSFLQETSLAASFMISQYNYNCSLAYKIMANRIAHLTSTPLAMASDTLKRIRATSNDSKLDSVIDLIKEADDALERAFLFDDEVVTSGRVDFDALRYLYSAVSRTEILLRHTIRLTEEFKIQGNPFRFFVALRDLFWCARTISKDSFASIQSSGEDTVEVTIIIPVAVGPSFKAEMLFSPQHHIEVDQDSDSRKSAPAGISLFLARCLLNEIIPKPNLEPENLKKGEGISIRLRIHRSHSKNG